MYRPRKPRKRGPVVSKKVSLDGYNFASSLEKSMYLALKAKGLEVNYESETFLIVDPFISPNDCFERTSSGKGEFKNRGGGRVLPMKYTPDFVGEDFIIECKGRANEQFPLRWKLFKLWLSKNRPDITLYKPQNKEECLLTAEIIAKKRKMAIETEK